MTKLYRWQLKPGQVFRYGASSPWRTVPPGEDGVRRMSGLWARATDGVVWSFPGPRDWDYAVEVRQPEVRQPEVRTLTMDKFRRACAVAAEVLQ